MIHLWKALILDNNGPGLSLICHVHFPKKWGVENVFSGQSGRGQSQSWATPNSSIAELSADVLFRGRGLHKFYATTSFCFVFVWVSPLHILNAPAYLTINYNNSDDSWVQKDGFLNNYWPHFFIHSFLFVFSIPHTKTTFWSSFVGVLSDWCQKMLWFACVRPFFHPFCLHISRYVQHSDGHWLKKVQSSLPWPTFGHF